LRWKKKEDLKSCYPIYPTLGNGKSEQWEFVKGNSGENPPRGKLAKARLKCKI
jgi:hypothetical protein